MQDPKKKEVGEMGKPSLKAKFEAAMQKKFDSDNKKKLPKDNSESLTRMVKNVREDKDPDWYKKEAIMSSQKRDMRSKLVKVKENMVPDMPKEDIQKYIKSVTPYKYKKPLKSMSKNKLKY